MRSSLRAGAGALCVVAFAAVATSIPSPVRAQVVDRGNLVVTGSATPDPAGSAGQVTYAISVKDDSTHTATGVTVTMTLPAGSQFVKCTPTSQPCQSSLPGVVTTTFPSVGAHATVKVNLVITMPAVTTDTTASLAIRAHADNAIGGQEPRDGTLTITSTILPLATRLLMSPSGRTLLVACGDTIDAAAFGADTDAQMLDGLVCNSGSGPTFTASGKTLNLGGKKIYSGSRVTGNAGLVVGPNAVNATIKGGGTQGTKGIEQFDYCVKDLGGNTGLHITDLRCFRAKTAGILSLSDRVLIDSSLVDNTIPDAKVAPEAAPGGVGIQVGGDNVLVKDTAIRRSSVLGFWAYGTDLDGSGVAATVDGTLATSRIEANSGMGALLNGGPHRILRTTVQGDDPGSGTSTEGIVVAADARGATIQEVDVKQHRGDGIEVEPGATATLIERTTVESIGGNGFVIGSPATLNGNSAQLVNGDCFVIDASATLTTNNAEMCGGDAFIINDAAVLSSNSAVNNAGYGFVLAHSSATGEATGPTFADVPVTHPMFDFIEAIFKAGITSGCAINPARYCPDAPVSRDQMSVFVLRAIDGPGVTPPPATGTVFADVPATDPFAPWIERFAALGITAGCGVNPPQYCPSTAVTRGQMAVFLLRTEHGASYQPPPAAGLFADVPPGHAFEPWIEQLAREGITSGCAVNPARFCPDSVVTRAQMAVLVAHTIGLPTAGGARLRTNNAESNANGGFLVSGSGNVLDANDAKNNGGTGFEITGRGNALDTNGSERSDGPEFAIGPNNADAGGNAANGARFSFTAAGGTFE